MRFRFVDRIVSFENGDRPKLVTIKAFPHCDDYTVGHPQRPGEVPNCLVLETLANAGARLVYCHSEEKLVGVLLRVDEAEIFSPVLAGEEVTVETDLLGLQSGAYNSVGLARTQGEAFVGSRKVAGVRLVLLCFPKDGLEQAIPW